MLTCEYTSVALKWYSFKVGINAYKQINYFFEQNSLCYQR